MRKLALFLSLWPAAVFAAPEDPGPLATSSWDAGLVSADGVQVPLEVHFPSSGGPFPVVTVMHGNLRTGRFHAVLAETLASRGMVVLLPDMPCGLSGCDHEANARQLQALLEWAVVESAGSGPLAGKVDGARRGMIGHSYGGLGTFLAARPNNVGAVVLFDPKDDGAAAAQDAAMVTVPSAHLMATTRGACNDDWGTAVYPQTGAPHLRVRVVGAGHCDAEDPSDSLCPLACGRGDRSTTPIFRRYAVAFLGCVLTGDASYAPYLGGGELAADVAANRLDQVDQAELATLPCQGTGSVDAGTVVDAGVSGRDGDLDAGPAADAGAPPPPDAGPQDASLADGGTPELDAGASSVASGCRAVGLKDAAPPWALLLLLGGALRSVRGSKRARCTRGS